MCGIIGYVSQTRRGERALVLNMAKRISHRGPDMADAWCDETAGIALGHRRLSILDLSEAGSQPMTSADGRYVIVYNGEIYNHRDLRAELETNGWSAGWRGHSDTETLLAALQLWGLTDTLPRLNGMFAFALWDRKARKLFLARDRIGEKPLFYRVVGNSFVFGSELKAMAAFPDWQGAINRGVLSLYLRHGYVPEPHCIIENCKKVPPGHWVEVDGITATEPVSYWNFRNVALSEKDTRPTDVLIDELELLLKRAVGLRMEADVPIGAFLSGGLDSSTIAALMQAQLSRPVRTFTIGFEVPGYNEAENAKAIAKHLGTSHTELYLTPQDALNVIPELSRIWDEPFADSSQIPTLLLSRMTRQHVTVALSGDAGDELFCGYNRYNQGYSLYNTLRRMPAPLRKAIATSLIALPAHTLDRLIEKLPKKFQYPAVGDRLNKLGMVIRHSSGTDFYRALVSLSQTPVDLVPDAHEPETLLARSQDWPQLDDFREVMMYLDTLVYLPGDILTKVDRASMATSLEARVPFLDNDVIDFAWSLPTDMKLRDGKSKWALRQVLERYVPNELVDRPKMGFGIPIEHWLRRDLRDWAEDLLSPSCLADGGYFDVAKVRTLWEENCSGKGRHHHQLWAILMFQSWRFSSPVAGLVKQHD